MSSKKRRIKKASISFVSLCPQGKNKIATLYKEDGKDMLQIDTLVKLQDEGTLLAVVYVPEHPDSEGDVASTEVVKEMAHSHMQSGAMLDVRHNLKPLSKEDAFVAESFIVQKGDKRFADMTDRNGSPVDVTGAWAQVIKLESPELRALYKDEGWQGVSLYGEALVVAEKSEEDTTPKENEVNTQEIVALVLKALDEKSKAEPAAPAGPAAPDAKPVFTGSALSKQDLESYRTELRAWEIQQKIAKAETAEEVEQILKSLDPAPANDAGDEDTLAKAQERAKKAEEELTLAKAEVEKLNKAGNPAADGSSAEDKPEEIKKCEAAKGRILAHVNQK